MGKPLADIMKKLPPGFGTSTEDRLDHLTKLVHILWKELEKYERLIQITPDGLRIKVGMSEVLMLKNGGIILDGTRIYLKTLGKDQLMY